MYLEKWQEDISMQNLLNIIFDKDSDWVNDNRTRHKEIATNPDVKTLLDLCLVHVSDETERYSPFCAAANYIVSLLRDGTHGDSIILCRNDPSDILGSATELSPCCVVVDHFLDEKPGPLGELTTKDTIKPPFYWRQILTFFEFKLVNLQGSRKTPGAKNALSTSDSFLLRALTTGDGSGSSLLPKSTRSTPLKRQSENILSSQNRPLKKTKMVHRTATSSNNNYQGSNYHPDSAGKGFKKKSDSPQLEDYIQCVSYALEMLSHAPLATHRVGFLIIDGLIQLQYFDRSITIFSEQVSFVKEPTMLVALLDCLVSASREQWGFLNHISIPKQLPPLPQEDDLSYMESSTFKCKHGATLTLGKIILHRHNINGRSTFVVRVTSDVDVWMKKSLVMKVTFTPEGKMSEGRILEQIKHQAGENATILDHLPELLHYEVLPATATPVQTRLAEYLKSEKIEYEGRAIHILVMTELHPITDLKTGEDVVTAVRGIVKCYKWLYTTVELIHRDVSRDNMMYRLKDGQVVGVLNDFDLAIFLSSQNDEATSEQRTGTIPYMAMDLLKDTNEPCLHLYRHDLESILYVMVDLGYYRLASSQDKLRMSVSRWFTGTGDNILYAKCAFLTSSIIKYQATSTMKALEPYIQNLHEMFQDGLYVMSKDKEDLDKTTMGGHVTLDTFARVFDLE